MANLQQRVEDYIGTFSDTAALDSWLVDECKNFINLAPSQLLNKYKSWIVATTDLDDGRFMHRVILAATAGGLTYTAKEVSYEHLNKFLDANSLHLATSRFPVYCIVENALQTAPTGLQNNSGSLVYWIPYPDIYADTTENATELNDYPAQMIDYATVGAAIRGTTANLGSAIAGLDDITAPTVPSAPAFTYTDSAGQTVTATTISLSAATQPTYTAPVFSGLTTPVTDLSVTTTLSATLPTAPGIVYVDASADTFTASTLTFTTTAPTFTLPVFEGSFTDTDTYIDTDEDLEQAATEIQAQNALINKYATDVGNAGEKFKEGATEYQAELQRSIEDARNTMQNEIASANATTDLNLKNAHEQVAAEIQRYGLELQRYKTAVDAYNISVNAEIAEFSINLQNFIQNRQTAVQIYSADIQNAVADFQEDMAIYQAEVQLAHKNAELLQQKLLNDAQRIDSIALANSAKNLEENVSEYMATLQKFQGDLQRYMALVATDAKEIESYQLLLAHLKGIKQEIFQSFLGIQPKQEKE